MSIGKVQQQVLRWLVVHGEWYGGCGWVWDTRRGTERVLASLVERGLVEIGRRPGRPFGVYRPTEEGKRVNATHGGES